MRNKYSFAEAIQALKLGKKITRMHNVILGKDDSITAINRSSTFTIDKPMDRNTPFFTIDDVLAKDWIIIQD